MVFSERLSSDILINSSAEKVWRLITDFKDFPQWNPFLKRASGDVKPGAKLKLFIQPSGGRGMTFKPIVLKVEPNRELRWLGRFYAPRLFDGEHSLVIEPLSENRVRFIQSEKFTGLLVPFAGRLLRDTKRGFEEMNRALKQRAEAPSAAEGSDNESVSFQVKSAVKATS